MFEFELFEEEDEVEVEAENKSGPEPDRFVKLSLLVDLKTTYQICHVVSFDRLEDNLTKLSRSLFWSI